MGGDYTRFTFDSVKGFSGVRKQQGRVCLEHGQETVLQDFDLDGDVPRQKITATFGHSLAHLFARQVGGQRRAPESAEFALLQPLKRRKS